MKCNNFSAILKQLEETEKKELMAAVLAHGGRYRFEHEDERVTITFDTADELDGAADVEVCQVFVNIRGNLVISGIPRDQLDEIELDPDDAAPGHLHYITEAIPNTATVSTVKTPVTLTFPDDTPPTGQQKTKRKVKEAIALLDRKYFNKITDLVADYITEYLRRMHPEMSQDKVDEMINLHANGWYSELVSVFLALENLPADAFDSGKHIN